MSVFISPFNFVYDVAGTSHVLHETLRNVLSMHSTRPLAYIFGTDILGFQRVSGLEYGNWTALKSAMMWQSTNTKMEISMKSHADCMKYRDQRS